MGRFRAAVRRGVGQVARAARQCCLSCIGVQDRDTRPRTAPPPTHTPSSFPPTPLQTSVPPTAVETPHSPPPAPLCSTPLTSSQPPHTDKGRASAVSCLSTDDSAYGSQNESSVPSTCTLTRTCSCLQLAGERMDYQLQLKRSNSLSFECTAPTQPTQQPQVASNLSLASSVPSMCTLTRTCSCLQLAGKRMENQLQLKRSKSLLFELTAPTQPTQQLQVASNLSLASSHNSHEDLGQRCEGRPFEVTLQQRVSGVGLLLGSGVSGGVMIKYMVSFGTAAKEGTLRTGDHLLEVNGHSVVGKSVEEVRSLLWWIPRKEKVTILAMAPPKDLTPLRSPFFTGRISVTLKTSYFCPPGIDVEGGGDSHIQIASITPDSPADLCGRLRVGDELVEVNGRPMVGASLSEAVAVLQQHCLPMHITVQCRTVPEPITSH